MCSQIQIACARNFLVISLASGDFTELVEFNGCLGEAKKWVYVQLRALGSDLIVAGQR